MYGAVHSSSERFFPTFLQKLDTLLQGGIPTGCITEVGDNKSVSLLIKDIDEYRLLDHLQLAKPSCVYN